MKTILVALDGSPRASGVLASAVGLAELTGGKLVLLRAFGLPAEMPQRVWQLPEGSLEDVLRHNAQAYLDEIQKTVPPDLLAGTRVGLGSPWQIVCTAAREEQVDLVVIGAHGFSGLDHILGTTAAKIVNHIDRSVLVVRDTPPAVTTAT